MTMAKAHAQTGSVAERDTEAFIDLLRGVAAFMVLFGHSLGAAVTGVYGEDLQAVPAGWHWLLSSVGFGGFWVWAFFVLSGLCIQQSVARSMQRGTYTFSSYFAARVTRLYPMFLTGMALTVIALAVANRVAPVPEFITWKQFIGTLCMTQLVTGTLPSFGASWSLTNEMTYYLLWPLGLAIAARNSRRAVGMLVILSLLVTVAFVVPWKLIYHGDAKHWLVPCWGLSAPFIIWLGGAWLGTDWDRISAAITRRRWLWALGALGLVYAAVTVIMHRRLPAWVLMTAGYFATPAFMVVIAGSRHFRMNFSGRWGRVAVWMGAMSYPCYILHGPLMWLTESLILPQMPAFVMANPTLRLLALIIPIFAVVGTAGVGLEKFFMNWRRGFLRRAASPARAVPG